jgi:hypothetical protein
MAHMRITTAPRSTSFENLGLRAVLVQSTTGWEQTTPQSGPLMEKPPTEQGLSSSSSGNCPATESARDWEYSYVIGADMKSRFGVAKTDWSLVPEPFKPVPQSVSKRRLGANDGNCRIVEGQDSHVSDRTEQRPVARS